MLIGEKLNRSKYNIMTLSVTSLLSFPSLSKQGMFYWTSCLSQVINLCNKFSHLAKQKQAAMTVNPIFAAYRLKQYQF